MNLLLWIDINKNPIVMSIMAVVAYLFVCHVVEPSIIQAVFYGIIFGLWGGWGAIALDKAELRGEKGQVSDENHTP